jgi:hypothetical protein
MSDPSGHSEPDKHGKHSEPGKCGKHGERADRHDAMVVRPTKEVA